MKLKMDKYKLTPVEAAKATNLSLRHPNKVEIHWELYPVIGRKSSTYRKLKDHVEQQVRWLAILSTDELFRVKEAISDGLVPDIFREVVDIMYSAKSSGKYVVELTIGDNINQFPLFAYESEEALNNPGMPKDAFYQDKPGTVLVRKNKVPTQPIQQIPEATMRMIQTMKNKQG